MESLFANVGSLGNENSLNSANNEFVDSYEAKIRALIADAADFDMSELSPEREENMEYYYGISPGVSDKVAQVYDSTDDSLDYSPTNKSDIVSTDVRDTVMSIMPSLIRIFTSSENIATFVPRNEEQSAMAKQATDDILYTFWEECGGFLLLHNIFKDVLTQKVGILKFGTTDQQDVKVKEFRNVTTEQLQMMVMKYEEGFPNGAQVEVIEQKANQQNPELIEYIKLRFLSSTPTQFIEAVAPEDFRISRHATSLEKAQLVGSSVLLSASDVIAKGYSKELVEQYTGSYDYYKVERQIRNPGMDSSYADRDLVQYGEYFVRIDQDGDGIDELHLVCTLGDNYDIVNDEMADYVQLVAFCGDPRPHTVIGDAIADLTKDIQKIKTFFMRGAIDSLAQHMSPDLVVNETLVNIEDTVADGVGRIIRTKGDPTSTVMEMRSSFVGEAVFAMMAQLDLVRQSRTGISEASKGVDPKAMQSTNLAGIEAIVTGAQERIELIARILAETGFKDLMKGLLRETVANPNPGRTYELRGEWVTVDQTLFDESMRVRVNPSLGKGTDTTRMMALQMIQGEQSAVMQQMGLTNPIVTIEQRQNTITDLLSMVNIRDTSRYFTKVTPEMMQQLSAPAEPSPEDKFATAELEKVKKDIVVATAKMNLEEKKLVTDDAFKRDQLGLTTLVNLTKIIGDIKKSAEVAESGVSAK